MRFDIHLKMNFSSHANEEKFQWECKMRKKLSNIPRKPPDQFYDSNVIRYLIQFSLEWIFGFVEFSLRFSWREKNYFQFVWLLASWVMWEEIFKDFNLSGMKIFYKFFEICRDNLKNIFIKIHFYFSNYF